MFSEPDQSYQDAHFMARPRTKLLLFVYIICAFIMVPNRVVAEDLWYTIQLGSYLDKKDAKSYYNTLSEKLPAQYQTDLRIEYISSYYAVRVGKSKSSKELLPLFEISKLFSDQPLIMYAYIRQARITWPLNDLNETKTDVLLNSPINSGKFLPQNKAALSPKPSPASHPAKSIQQEDLFYTIQTGSFLKKDAATRLYDTLSKKLPSEMRLFLRIEKISSFYTVRFGKSVNKQGTVDLLIEAKKITKSPVLLQAHIKERRIITSFSDIQPKPAALRQTTVSKNVPTKPSPKALGEELKPVETDAKDFSALPAANKKPSSGIAKAKSSRENEPPLQPRKIKASLSSQEYEKMLLAKYLNTSVTSKNRAEAQKKTKSFAAEPNCTTASCHNDMQKITRPHYPVQQDKCLACHKQLNQQHPKKDNNDFKLLAEGAALCQQCHISTTDEEVIHSPAAQGECLQCHNPHGSNNPFLLPVSKENQQDLCLKCHDRSIVDHRYQHGPVGLGNCTFCHAPHASPYKFLLRDEPNKLCVTCHSEFKKGLQDSPYIHTPVKNRECQYCHAVHGSEFPNLLTSEPGTFCFSCHPDIEKKFTKSRVKHSGLYLDQQCGTCHLGHYSSNKSLLIYEEKELCLTCHGNNSHLKSYSPKNIEQEISNKEYIHAPVAQGQCSSCHDPHGSQFDSLLVAQYPSSFYAPYDSDLYDLCFRCHDKKLLTAQTTSDGTKFRNGSRNLHFVHVAIERKGRTCNACHNPHASDGPKLINRTGAKFGEWTMSIDFNLTDTGGSCMPGCHRKMKYDRKIPIINKSKNTTFEKYYIDYKSQ